MQAGDSRVEVLTDDLTRTQIVQYAGASGDCRPVFASRASTFAL